MNVNIAVLSFDPTVGVARFQLERAVGCFITVGIGAIFIMSEIIKLYKNQKQLKFFLNLKENPKKRLARFQLKTAVGCFITVGVGAIFIMSEVQRI